MSKKAQAEANIQTFLRIRPSKVPSGYFTEEGGSLKFNLPDKFDTSGYVNNSKTKHAYHFNDTIGMKATQEEVFKKVGSPAVQNALDGFNSTIFAYGQTGSGKTFTLTGGAERYVDRGIIPRSISMIYNEFRSRSDVSYKAYISYLEIYNEQGYDLLDPSHETKALEDLPKVNMLEDEHGNFHLKNLSMHAADTEEDALNLLFMGDTNRAIAETPMNMASSRSHCIFTVAVEARVVGSDVVRRSKLHLVDLAGSERVAKTNSSGSVLNEAKYINTSLFYLEMVIVALYEKATKGRNHVPYRNSTMTSVLRDSLGGNCKTVMIATINPEQQHTGESLSTCKFAQRVSLIKNRAMINEEADPNVVIRRLKNEMMTLREEISYLKNEAGEGDALTPVELDELKTSIREYLQDMDPESILNIGTMTLTKLRHTFSFFKQFVKESSSGNHKGPYGGSGGGEDSLHSEGEEELIKQVDDLKSCLLQRDNEIAILVNMVKKGKTAEDVSASRNGGSRIKIRGINADNNNSSLDSARSSMDSAPMNYIRSSQEEIMGKSRDSNRANASVESANVSGLTSMETSSVYSSTNRIEKSNASTSNSMNYKDLQQRKDKEREANKQNLILQRHLFGVPPPTDRSVFDDAAKSFDWFSERCSLRAAAEENREILREKINEAKSVGERANASRNTITYLKNSIESIRREKALQRVDNSGLQDSKEAEETEQESTHRRAIEQEKAIYKQSFERLRILKPEIEHIRKVGRYSLQKISNF